MRNRLELYMKLSTFFILFLGSLLIFTVYELSVFQSIRQADQRFEINTRFNEGDVMQWLAPTRKAFFMSRWHENITATPVPAGVNPFVIKDCILAEKPCADMLDALAQPIPVWKTGAEILQQKSEVCKELHKQLRQGKIVNKQRRTIKTVTLLSQELEEELALLRTTHDQTKQYRFSCSLYNLVNYTPFYFFSALHYSKFISKLPEWIKNILNYFVSSYVQSRYEGIKTETTKLAHKQSPWYYRWHIADHIEKTFEAIKARAEQHTYIHDYSPYYQKLRRDFDLEVKNVYDELERLIERNLALQEILKMPSGCTT